MNAKNRENQNNEVVVVNPNEMNSIVENTDDLIALAERRLDNIQRLKRVALKSTTCEDWTNQNGKPYLNSSGAEKVARLFGVKITSVKKEKIISQDEKGNFYFYMVTGIAHLPGQIDSIEAVGTCSSKDQFFAKVGGEFKPLSEIDETNILKAAYSNFITNAITRLLGIRGLTWDLLKETGIDSSKVPAVKYSKGSKGGAQITKEDKDKQVEIREKLLNWANGDKNAAANKLEELTAFVAKDGNNVPGKRSCTELHGPRLNIAYEKVMALKNGGAQ